MSKINNITIKCGYCNAVSPWPIGVSDSETLDGLITEGNLTNCLSCGRMIDCNKDNVGYSFADGTGGGRGDNYSGNIGDSRQHPPSDPFSIARQQLAEYRKNMKKD